MEDFKPLLIEQINDIYCLENETKRVIPKLMEAAQDFELEKTLEAQLQTTEFSLKKIEEFSKVKNFGVTNADCHLLQSVVQRAVLYLKNGPINDAGIMSHLERINQYKTAIYNAAIRFAKATDEIQLYKELQNLANHTYNILDRLARLDTKYAIYKL